MAKRQEPQPRKNEWVLTQDTFRRFLDWLDGGTDSRGQRYLEMHERLVLYFDRKNCLSPHELADETMSRVARRLEEEGEISTDTPAHYCYIVARFVFLESLRGRGKQEVFDENVSGVQFSNIDNEYSQEQLDCLEQCVRNLDSSDSALIVAYYQGEQRLKIENRKALAAGLKMSLNALSIRACRIRNKLGSCMRKCLNIE